MSLTHRRPRLTTLQTEPYPEQRFEKPELRAQDVAPKQRMPLAPPAAEKRPGFVQIPVIVRTEIADALDTLLSVQRGELKPHDTTTRAQFWRGEILEIYAIEHIPAALNMTFPDYLERRRAGATLRDLKIFAKSALIKMAAAL